MKPKAIAVFCISLGVCGGLSASPQPITIEPVVLAVPAASVPQIPLAAEGDNTWFAGKPVWEGASGEISAKCWMATTDRGFLFRVVVQDPKQENPYGNAWALERGDCIYLSIDARGDDEAEAFGPDDATYLFALAANGPVCRLVRHGNPLEQTRSQLDLIRSIRRDESARTTTYDLLLPFDRLSTAVGQSVSCGVALTIAHKDADGKELKWGAVFPAQGKARELQAVALPGIPGAFATLAPRRTDLSSSDMDAQVTVATRGGTSITVQAGDQTARYDVAPGEELQRFRIRLAYDSVTAARHQVQVTVGSPAAEAQCHATVAVLTPDVLMELFQQRITHLLATAPNDVIREHLKSTLRVVSDAHARLAIEKTDHPARVAAFLQHVKVLLSKLPEQRFDWNDAVRKCMPLVGTFVSEEDSTLQFYALQLPFDYQPGKAYPLTVYLHGAGDPNPLAGLRTAFDNSHQDTLFRTVEIRPEEVPPSHRGFVLAPWARGNSGYRGAGEADVWQSMEHVQSRFKIDPDRVYLTGFSMGCGGTMALASRQPDRFAGINLAAGFGTWSDTSLDYLAENLRDLPIVVWCGEFDFMIEGCRAFHSSLEKKGIAHEYRVVPLLPHTYPYDEYQQSMGYLMQFTRQRPRSFAYTTDTRWHTGRNGVVMNVPFRVSEGQRPEMKCRIEGQSVYIDSHNTEGLSVDLGPEGLGLSGEVKVFWNQQQAYTGPATRIELGKAPAR